MTRCKVCGYLRSRGGAVQEFTARTAAAVTAAAFSLHSGLAEQSDDEMLRRLLIFADSRQDTAFQAGYLRDRSRAVQVRRLIMDSVRVRAAAGQPAASFNGLVADVFERGQATRLYEDPAGVDARQRALRVCEWDVLGEIASDERRPPTLERLGVLTVGYPGLDALSDEDLRPFLSHVGGETAAARWLLARVLDLARTRGGVGHELLRARLGRCTAAVPSGRKDRLAIGARRSTASAVSNRGTATRRTTSGCW